MRFCWHRVDRESIIVDTRKEYGIGYLSEKCLKDVGVSQKVLVIL